MEDKHRRSSILKPLKSLGDQDLCENNIGNSINITRRVSFANSNLVKPFVEDEDKNTIWDSTYEESPLYTDSSVEGTIAKSSERTKNTLNESKVYVPDVVFSNSDMDITPLNIVPNTKIAISTLMTSSDKENINYMAQNSINVEKLSMELTEQIKMAQNSTNIEELSMELTEQIKVAQNSTNVEELSMEFTQQLPISLPNKIVRNADETLSSCDMEFTKVVTFPSPKVCSAKVTEKNTDKTLQNSEVTNNAIEDTWCSLTKYKNDTLNISLEDMPCLSYDEENFGTPGPSKSDISKVMCGDYNPSFNSKIMNALPMSFNSDLIPKFLSKSVENSLNVNNQNNSILKENSVFLQPTFTQPSMIEVTDIDNKFKVSNVNYTEIDFSNVTFFKEIEDTDSEVIEIDKDFDKKAEERINTAVRKIALLKDSLMEKIAVDRKRRQKRMEFLYDSVKETDTLIKTVNGSMNISSADDSTSTDKPEVLSLNCKSIKEKVEELASRNDGFWDIISLEDKCYKFSTFKKTIIFCVIIHPENGIVHQIEVIDNIDGEKSEPFAKFCNNLFMEKLNFATVQSALGSDEFEIISFLEYVYVTVDKLLDMCKTYNDLRRDFRYALKMDDTYTVSFHITRPGPAIHWIINVNMSDVNNITVNSVDVNVMVGDDLIKNKIKRIIPECQKGFEFLPDFIQKIEQYVATLPDDNFFCNL